MTLAHLEAEKSSIKRLLLHYDKAFAAQYGHAPARIEKVALKPVYARHSMVKKQLQALMSKKDGTKQNLDGTSAHPHALDTGTIMKRDGTYQQPAGVGAPLPQSLGIASFESIGTSKRSLLNLSMARTAPLSPSHSPKPASQHHQHHRPQHRQQYEHVQSSSMTSTAQTSKIPVRTSPVKHADNKATLLTKTSNTISAALCITSSTGPLPTSAPSIPSSRTTMPTTGVAAASLPTAPADVGDGDGAHALADDKAFVDAPMDYAQDMLADIRANAGRTDLIDLADMSLEDLVGGARLLHHALCYSTLFSNTLIITIVVKY